MNIDKKIRLIEDSTQAQRIPWNIQCDVLIDQEFVSI